MSTVYINRKFPRWNSHFTILGGIEVLFYIRQMATPLVYALTRVVSHLDGIGWLASTLTKAVVKDSLADEGLAFALLDARWTQLF